MSEAAVLGTVRAALLWTTLGLLIALIITGGITIGRSIRGSVADQRRETALKRLRPMLFERIERDDPEWDAWLSDRSSIEQAVLESEVDSLLRLFTGGGRDRICALAKKLEAGQRAARPFDTHDRTQRLKALSWLALLDYTIDVKQLREHCSFDPDERAAVARVFYEHDVQNASTVGTQLLLRTGKPLSLFGLDTLYRLNEADPTALFESGASRYTEWTDALLAQVLETIQYCDPVGDDTSFEWLFLCLSHETPTVRAAAIGALGTYTWRQDVQSHINVTWLVTDPDPEVRRATYRHLTERRGSENTEMMINAATAESDDRALLTIAEQLAERLRGTERDLPADLHQCLNWIIADRSQTE